MSGSNSPGPGVHSWEAGDDAEAGLEGAAGEGCEDDGAEGGLEAALEGEVEAALEEGVGEALEGVGDGVEEVGPASVGRLGAVAPLE